MTLEEQVKSLREKFGNRIPHHDCTLCGQWVAYVFVGEDLFFDSACGCSLRDESLQPRDIADLHQFLDMNPGWTERMIHASTDG